MSPESLSQILISNERYDIDFIKQIIYELKLDVFDQYSSLHWSDKKMDFYIGEHNAFQICLDLLDHLDNSKCFKCSFYSYIKK